MEANTHLRMTRQRKIILEELSMLRTHPTAAELCALVRNRIPQISLGTIYRNLEILSRRGDIAKTDVPGQEMRFDANAVNHYHVRCTQCGRVDDLDLQLMDGLEERAEASCGYKLQGHHLDFFGVCSDCMRQNKTSGALD